MKVKDLVYRMVADWAEQTAGRSDVVVKATKDYETFFFPSSGYVYTNLQRWIFAQVTESVDDDTPPAEVKLLVDESLDNVEFLTDDEALTYYADNGVEDYDVEVFGNTYSAVTLLQECDPVAFREMYLGWLDTQEIEAMELC